MENKSENREVAIRLSGVKKRYKLGQIGGGTLQGDLQSWWARIHGREDPNSIIGQEQRLVGQTFMALNGIDLTVYKGEALGIIGANGAGKSTMLKLLSRVTAPTEGEIDIYGRIASMLEVGTGFNGEMTGRENIYMNGAILGMTKSEIDSKMEQIIDFSEVREFIDTPVKRYSSGMYVKLAFSVAAHLDSEIMIMDEVLAVGDIAFQSKCLEKMREAADREGRTILYVSHNMNTIRQLCDRCIVLDKGRIVFDGEVEEAIRIYIDTNKSEELFVDYADFKRPAWLTTQKLKLISAEFLGKESTVFENSEIMRLRLKWLNLEDIENAGLRIEIRTLDDVGRATYVLYNLYSGKEKQTAVCDIELDISMFMNAHYKMLYTFFYKGKTSSYQNVGWAPGLGFEVLPASRGDENELAWKHKTWGYIRMPDAAVLSSRVSTADGQTPAE